MSQDNVEVVRGLYDAWSRGGGVPPFELIDPAIEAEVVRGLDNVGTIYRGHAGVSELLESFWDVFERHRIEVEECVPAGEDVLVTVHYYGRGRASSVEVDMRGWHVWTLRNRKAVRWRVFNTRREAFEAVGLAEQNADADS
jgi:ketosteroid isomerase-like protein